MSRFAIRPVFLTLVTLLTIGCSGENPYDDLTEFEPYDPRERLQQIYELEVENVVSLIENNPDLMIIDVRSVDLFNEKRLPDASHYDFKSGAFDAEIDAVDHETPLLLYGTRDEPDSSLASTRIRDLGFSTIYLLKPGIEAWIEAGHPFEKGL